MSQVRAGGTLKVVTGSNPAAGAEVSDTVPAGKVWRLYAILVALVTDGNAANRRVQFTFDDGTTVFARKVTNQLQTASLTYTYSFGGTQVGTAVLDNVVTDPLPVFDLPAGSRIKSVTSNKAGGDDYGTPQYYIDEFDAP